MAKGTDSAELPVSATLQMLKTYHLKDKCLVENDNEAANRERRGDIDVIDPRRRRERRVVVKHFRSASVTSVLASASRSFVRNHPCFEVCGAC